MCRMSSCYVHMEYNPYDASNFYFDNFTLKVCVYKGKFMKEVDSKDGYQLFPMAWGLRVILGCAHT